jgi:hypothetical protein
LINAGDEPPSPGFSLIDEPISTLAMFLNDSSAKFRSAADLVPLLKLLDFNEGPFAISVLQLGRLFIRSSSNEFQSAGFASRADKVHLCPKTTRRSRRRCRQEVAGRRELGGN